jgi:hypothetical protein
MHRTITAAIAATAILGATPATVGADPHTRCDSTETKTTYSRYYYRVAHVHGDRTPGRNIRRDGHTNGRKSTCADLRRSTRTFRRWLAPPLAPVSSTDVTPTSSRTSATYTGGRYSIPSSIVMCESRGDYGAYNPSSGAFGAYQIIPSTAAAFGCDLSTPGGQDSCAARIWAGQGRGAWSC